VLKSSGSAFTNFIRDEYTTLVEVDDRIFSTSIDLEYVFSAVEIVSPADPKQLDFALRQGFEVEGQGGVWDAQGVAERARKVTLETFAEDESASVQVVVLVFFSSKPDLIFFFH